ncbi:MAG: phosphoribosylanthranilate isomerase [Deltaproteobacteria bacterium]
MGINFYPGSVRYVPPERASPIVEAVGGRAVVVGVFVNESPETISRICAALGIRTIQLSGNEPAAEAEAVSGIRVKAMRLSGTEIPEGFRNYPCEAFLIDAHIPGAFGGTGVRLDWASIGARFGGRRIRFEGDSPERQGRPWILAGGLGPENVREAIRLARPFGVDVAGGIESAPGRKDPDRVRRFVENAREGLAVVDREA